MAVLKIAEYRLAQDQKGGFVAFCVLNTNGSISDWIGGGWRPVPITQFASLIGMLTTNNAYYDDAKGMFLMGTKNALAISTKSISENPPLFDELKLIKGSKVFKPNSSDAKKNSGSQKNIKKIKTK